MKRSLRLTRELTHAEYLKSPLWLDRHPKWLRQGQHRCSLLFLPVGRHKRKYHPYAIHHMHYWEGYQGSEVYGRDVILLSRRGHWIIHQVCGGAKHAGKQSSPFPNELQRLVHAWCRLPLFLKQVLAPPITLAFLMSIAYLAGSIVRIAQ